MRLAVRQPTLFRWFEIFRCPGRESENAFVRAHTDTQAVLRYARRCGGDAAQFYAVAIQHPCKR